MMHEKMRMLAEKWHAGQFREGKEKIPYIEHPRSVVQNLADWGEPEDSRAIDIAWGHDLLEDTGVTGEEILTASGETVLREIYLLTHRKGTPKPLYLQNVAKKGSRDALLVKISDRIQNTRDFVKLSGKLRAFRYLHSADCIFEAVQKLPRETVLMNAVAAWKELDESLREDARHDAIRGCLLGGAAGDALGAPVEFLNLQSIRRIHGADGVTGYSEFGTEGAITDDTQMTLFTAEGILRANTRSNEKGICDPVSVMRYAYLRWLKTQGVCMDETDFPEEWNSGWLIHEKQLFAGRAPGMTCLASLKNSRSPETARNSSKGCGTVMRMAPVGLFLNPEDAYRYGCQFSALTHGHPTGITAGGVFAMLIAYLLTGKPLEDALDAVLDFADRQSGTEETCAALRKVWSAKDVTEFGDGWVAEEALAIGVYCALKHSWNFRKGVLLAVNIDGDSDSAGAIAGNILGVINGETSIPETWRSCLREREIVLQVADDLWKRFEAGPEGHVTKEWREKYPGF